MRLVLVKVPATSQTLPSTHRLRCRSEQGVSGYGPDPGSLHLDARLRRDVRRPPEGPLRQTAISSGVQTWDNHQLRKAQTADKFCLLRLKF
jgi:hypothetical protein